MWIYFVVKIRIRVRTVVSQVNQDAMDSDNCSFRTKNLS